MEVSLHSYFQRGPLNRGSTSIDPYIEAVLHERRAELFSTGIVRAMGRTEILVCVSCGNGFSRAVRRGPKPKTCGGC